MRDFGLEREAFLMGFGQGRLKTIFFWIYHLDQQRAR
jgi:hypothetical protein